MHQIDFSPFIEGWPKLYSAWKLLKQWDIENPQTTLDLAALHRLNNSKINPYDLGKAVQILVESCVLKQEYQVRTPEGNLVGPVHRKAEYIQKDKIGKNNEIVAIFRKELSFEHDHGAYIPSMDEIKAKCEEIRNGWRPTDFKKRSFGFDPSSNDVVEIPAYGYYDLSS